MARMERLKLVAMLREAVNRTVIELLQRVNSRSYVNAEAASALTVIVAAAGFSLRRGPRWVRSAQRLWSHHVSQREARPFHTALGPVFILPWGRSTVAGCSDSGAVKLSSTSAVVSRTVGCCLSPGVVN
jgi:hypothetical protein